MELQWKKERNQDASGFYYEAGAGAYRVGIDYGVRKCFLWIANERREVQSVKEGRWQAQQDYAARGHTMPCAMAQDTDADIVARISRQFDTLRTLAERCAVGDITSLIVSGPGGFGKSHPIRTVVQAARERGQPVASITGSISPVSLYKTLYDLREGGLLVLDDCDSVFDSTESLNILKAALDSSAVRTVSWVKESNALKQDGIPTTFDVRCAVVMISNIDFDAEIAKGNKRAPHLEAVMSRSLYLPIEIRTIAERLAWIRHMVASQNMLRPYGIVESAHTDAILGFVSEHAPKFRATSLREVVKIATLFTALDGYLDGSGWRAAALATLTRRK